MCRNEREIDNTFHPEEYLFRRVPTKIWDTPDPMPEADAIELPDISVGRSRYGHPEWTRLDPENDRYFKSWGIIGVKVGLIPPSYQPEGGPAFAYTPSHQPLEQDYPHTEIQAFQGELQLSTKESVPEELHLEWRGLLLSQMEALLQPRERRDIRQQPPTSHVLEPV